MTLSQSCRILLSGLLLILMQAIGAAKADPLSQSEPGAAAALTVASKQAPPFAMRANDGKWSGLAIELMEEIGRELSRKISWTFVDTTDDIIKAVATGKVDAGIAAVTITSERETKIDFSHPYYDTGLSIAVANRRTSGLWDITYAMISPAFLKTVGTLGVLLFFIGSLVWLFERQRNSDQFHKEPIKGIGNGIWWAAVTMTTVGYGDKTPTTPLGRAIAVIWMFAALILTALFTAHLASSLTAHRIAGPVASVSDLPSARVGIVEKSSSSLFFEKRFIRSTTFPDVSSGLHALTENKIDAFVHDEPILRYHIERDFHGVLDLLPHLFEPSDYGIVLPSGSVLRETVNQALLNVLSSPRWSRIRQRYLGQDRWRVSASKRLGTMVEPIRVMRSHGPVAPQEEVGASSNDWQGFGNPREVGVGSDATVRATSA